MVEPRNWTYENLQTITDMIPALISYFDAGHVCRFANNHHVHWYGRTSEELIGMHMREFLGEERYAHRLPFLERVACGEAVAFDARVPHLNGTLRDASIRYVPRIGDKGYEGFYTLVFDTAMHQHRFHSVFDGTAVAFWELDLSEARALRRRKRPVSDVLRAIRITDMNVKAATLFGMDRQQSLGNSIADRWPADSQPAFDAALCAFDRGAASFEAETKLLRADGTPLDVLINCAFSDAEGLSLTMVLGIVDLTERNAREAALAELQHELAHATRVAMLGELTASIAHEVNQPLGAVVNNGNAALRWLNRPEPAIDEVRRSLELLVGEAKRASDIIVRMRALAAKGTPERDPVEPAEIIGDARALVTRQVASLGATLHVTADRNLPVLMADRVQLQQVLVNLLINAAQAMAGQENPAEIRLSATATGAMVAFVVEDSGPGISPDKADQLFNAFYTTKASGMGIGLSVSKTIVEAHGGTIVAQATPSGGARFTFTIPAGATAATETDSAFSMERSRA